MENDQGVGRNTHINGQEEIEHSRDIIRLLKGIDRALQMGLTKTENTSTIGL